MNKLILCMVSVATLLGVMSCKCVNIPTIDNTLPSVSLTVHFEDAAGNSLSNTVNTSGQNTPINVVVPKAGNFFIVLSSSDIGGVKETLLDYSYTIYNNDGTAQNISPLLAPTTYGGCPKDTRLRTQEFQSTTKRRIFEFQASAKDYKNNRSETPVLTIHQQ